ncbi:MAG: ABC transporter permease [Chloroflexota bacterium]|jgi:osmoprotectant transport system permease protein|nr:ABC transporter permease [Chloroflexota bacterium]MDQ3345672.1 ABC transporter permease [Chloroflexota bacterium]
MTIFDYLSRQGDRLFGSAIEHVVIVLISVSISTVIGVALGVLTYQTQRPRLIALGVTGIFLTIPSFALFGLLIGPLGLGATPAVVALVMYGLLPIVRNTIVGLRSVDPAVVESAQGMGMGRYRRLLRIELPLAWPIIITGIRVAAVIIVGIAAIAAVVNGPGLGKDIFRALARFGTPTALPQALSAVLGIIIIAILIDLVFTVVARLTTSRGIRA